MPEKKAIEAAIIDDDMEQLLTAAQVLKATGLPVSSMYDLIREGRFPKPLSLGARRRAWKRSEITAWINDLPRADIGTE